MMVDKKDLIQYKYVLMVLPLYGRTDMKSANESEKRRLIKHKRESFRCYNVQPAYSDNSKIYTQRTLSFEYYCYL
jgi:hypothetical protein